MSRTVAGQHCHCHCECQYDQDAIQARRSQHSIHPLLLSRTSADELTGEPIADDELMCLFEASRWAPSFHNLQPWRFVYALPTSPEWPTLFGLLWPLNQEWCVRASALVVVISHKYYTYKSKHLFIPTHSFDTGMACLALALEANGRGLVAHFMAGFDYDRAYQVLDIPQQSYNIEAMIAVGRRPPKDKRLVEEPVSQRDPLNTFVHRGQLVPDAIVKRDRHSAQTE